MNYKIKILLAVLLLIAVLTRKKISNFLGFGKANPPADITAVVDEVTPPEEQEPESTITYLDDSLYRWDEQSLYWTSVDQTQEEYEENLDIFHMTEHPTDGPIKLTWEQLTEIRYRLRQFKALDMAFFSPVFPQSIKALHGKEVEIEGFIIPFDEEQELLSLSAYPFASCFFCGKASPASVMSMYLKNSKRFKMDDFKTFSGTLFLNYDNPDDFYYILRDAKEE